ncbi:MAG TPA: transglycosylase domain-containing protein [Solirubrobacterales bacterium]|nr:transglycosylase domain-containing protein [Solirubrobacterales bacterium]
MTQRNRRRRGRRGGIGSKVLIVGGAVFAMAAIAAIAVTSWVLDVAAEAPSLATCKPIDHGGNSTLYAADGSKLGMIAADEAHTPVAIDRIPKKLQLATVAIEDQRFYEHDALDAQGILRAALKNLEAGEAVEGGSTITQQLVRNLCIPNPERTIERKIEEAKLAIEYAERHSRREILGQYLNIASYGTIEGSTAVGVQAASRIYFDRPVWKLTLAQAALLAGLPQAPSEYNPILNPTSAKARRDEVLRKMAKLGYVSPGASQEAQRAGLGLDVSGDYFEHRQPYFFDYVENRLIEAYGVNTVRQGGLEVKTTIDPDLQDVGAEAMAAALPYSTDPSSALVSIDPRNGHIRAMVTSSNYAETQFNLAAQGRRQPGSTFKTFVLTAAIKQGIDPYSTYYTSKPLDLNLPHWGHWTVATADEGYQGTVNLQQATVSSDNTVFAQLDLDVGPKYVAQTAKSMGITTPLDGIPAEGLGGLRLGVTPLELTDAYATLAAGGVHRDPVAIEKVTFPDGRVGRPQAAQPQRVLSEAIAYEVTKLLHNNITEGTGTAAYTGCAGQAGKTGTTDEYTDAWFAGYQPNLATAVWVGYPESNDVSMYSVHGRTVFGGTFPAEIWHALYTGGGVPCEEFTEPEDEVSWSTYYSHFAQASPSATSGDDDEDADGGGSDEPPPPGTAAVGGYDPDRYDPDAYAPGAGQEPAPAPPPPPSVGGGEGAGES